MRGSDKVEAGALSAGYVVPVDRRLVSRYGAFINALLTFVSIATAVFFFVVKPMNYLMARMERGEEPVAETPPDIQLLTEIRDALRSRS